MNLGKLSQDLTLWVANLIRNNRSIRNLLVGSALGIGASTLINFILFNYIAK